MEIVFCERCGVSIPEHQLAGSLVATGGRNLCASCLVPPSEGDLRLYFCENCRVSIPVSSVITGQVRAEGSGYLCGVCSTLAPVDRASRRSAVERDLAQPGTVRRAAADPIYFCDSCNGSIAAVAVATGRALVRSGRTYCERCRPRVEAGAVSAGPGFVPVFAAALLAAAVTAGGLAAWEGRRAEDPKEAAAGQAVLRRELEEARAELRRTREAVGIARVEDAAALDRMAAELRKGLEATAAEGRAVAEEARSLRAIVGGGVEGPDRLQAVAGRVDRLDRGLQDLARSVDGLAAVVEGMKGPAAPPPPPPTADAPPASPEPPAPATDPAVPDAVTRSIALLADRDAGVRFQSAIELGRLGHKAAAAALAESLSRDEDVFVRRACARSLGELKAFEAFPALVDAIGDREEYVARQVAKVLHELAGQDFGFKNDQPKPDRKRVADRARKWWEENRERLLAMQ
jgi:hypothetical protein